MMNSQYQHQQQPQSIPHYQAATGPSSGSTYQQGHQRLNSTGSTPINIWEPQNPPQAPQRNHKRPAPQPGQIHVTTTMPAKPALHVSHHQSTYNNPPQFMNSQTQTTPPISLGHQHAQHSPKSPNQQFLHSTNVMSTSLTSHNTNLNLNNGGPVSNSLHINSTVSGGSCLTNANTIHNNNNINSNNNNFDNPNLNCTSTNATSSSSLVASTMSSGPVAHLAAAASHKKIDPKLQEMPWFHGSITREEAERLLQPRDDGLFLVRESTNYPGDYTLCVCFQSKVEHYRVKYEKNLLTIDDEEYFDNLAELIKHYEHDADGLCTQLIRCLPKVCIKEHIGEHWIINEAELTFKESIGKGEFGEVKLGVWKNQNVAVKVLKNLTVEFLKEAKMMSKLRHENIVTFHGVAQKNCYIHLIFEYMSKGSLVDYLRSRGRQHVTKKDQIDFAYDTCSGMAYLESEKVIHRDLAARNVLISENNVAKICDLGLACSNDSKSDTHIDVGKLPIKWTAPESLKGQGFSNKSDMWSFGILLWEIYSFGRVPYPRIPLAEVVKYVDQGYKMEAPEGCPPEVYEMMRRAWDLNQAKRPDFRTLKAELETLKKNTH